MTQKLNLLIFVTAVVGYLMKNKGNEIVIKCKCKL
uniref:Uncharacterized protein n=1 Tax=Lepeophtheirus salmonis TaxID=72036 RepID=A0A0K2TWD2_LEPSM